MSSLSRRACYKCGNVGHYAEVCSSSERLCYNCKSHPTHFHRPSPIAHLLTITEQANSRDTNPTDAPYQEQQKQSNAITVKDLGTCKLTAQLYDLAAGARVAAATTVDCLDIWLVLAPALLVLVLRWVAALPWAVVDTAVNSDAADTLVVHALRHATSVVVPTTLLAIVKHKP